MNILSQSQNIVAPATFIVRDFSPGLSIDWRNPARDTDIGTLRQRVLTESPLLPDMESRVLFHSLSQVLLDLGAVTDQADLSESLQAFTGQSELEKQIPLLGQELLLNADASAFEVAQAILEVMGVLREPPHFPCLLQCHFGGTTVLENDGTHFFFVLSGEGQLTLQDRQYSLYAQTYGSIPGESVISGNASILVITRFTYQGMFQLGGPLEGWGRLQYIDGCTDTVLIHPVKKGDACFNALYFPRAVMQTSHTHPSFRCGVVVRGTGRCITPDVEYDLSVGKVFFLPPETWHSFHTEDSELVVVAFHPDSDYGPSDQNHPMVNRTYYRVSHVLESFRRLNSKAI